ncbi:MAG: glycosyltransferase [Chloroflexota bacterium]
MTAKIMHVSGQMARGGAERQLLLVAEALAWRGWSQSVVIFNVGDPWQESFASFGVPIHLIPRHRLKLWRLMRLSLLALREHPDVVHSWSSHTNVYTTISLFPAGTKRLLSFRGNPMVDNRTGQARTEFANASIYRRADCIISNSRAALASVGAALAGQHTAVVGNITLARGRASPGEVVSRPRLIAAGELKPLKAFDVLLRALGLLKAEGAAFDLMLAGEGSEKAALIALAAELNLSECVHFCGEVADVPALCAGAHLLVHPSRSEGLSNTILEGMAEGLPVIACAVGGNSEIIDHERSGLLVPPDDPPALAQQIRRLLDDAALRQRLGNAALEDVRTRCNQETVVRQYEAVYNALLNPTKAL